MKFVPKVNVQGIKAVFVENVEKIAVFFGAICVVLAIFFAVRQETLKDDRQPARLRTNTDQARARVQDAGHVKLPVHEFMDDVTAGRAPIDLASYAFPSMFNSPVKEERVKRGLPTLLSIEQPHATAGYGAFAIKKKDAPPRPAGAPVVLVAPPPPRPKRVPVDPNDPSAGTVEVVQPLIYSPPISLHGHSMGGDSKPVGYRWVCVTGMIPTTRQDEEFVAKFKRAMKVASFEQGKDRPKYMWYYYEREEMAPDGTIISPEPTAPNQLASQSLAAWRDNTKGWEMNAQDVVPSEYVMTSSNPAAVGPLTCALGPLLLKSWDSRVSHPAILAATAPPPAAAAEVPGAAAQPEGLAGLGGDELPMGVVPEVKPSGPKVITHKLFRFFDYSVEPGKKYRYRVSLMFDNPNYLAKTDPKYKEALKYLEDPSLADDKYAFSPPSEWTNWVQVPADHRLLLAGLKSVGRAGAEPTVTVRAIAWDHADGVEVTKDFEMVRGDVADWIAVKDKVQYLDPAERVIKPLVSFDFSPRQLLLDVRGGGINGNNAPLEALLSDMRGGITIRNEEQDKAEAKIYLNMMTPADGGAQGGGH